MRGDSQLSGVESGQHKRNASGTGGPLRGKGNGNRGRSAENVRNDQLQEGLNADSRKVKSIDDTGLRVSDNSILVECENNSKYQYKYVVYDDMEDGPVIRDVYAIGRINPNVEDDVTSQCHEIARMLNGLEDTEYDNRKHV